MCRQVVADGTRSTGSRFLAIEPEVPSGHGECKSQRSWNWVEIKVLRNNAVEPQSHTYFPVHSTAGPGNNSQFTSPLPISFLDN